MFTVKVAMSGQHMTRGKFETLEKAKEFQAELHKQGWFYVPIYMNDDKEPFGYLKQKVS